MSVNQAQNALNQIEKDIAYLEKKMADLMKKEADKVKRISNIQRSITKNTSANMFNSKMRQIDSYQKEITRIVSDKADVNKKLADKRKKRLSAMERLQKEEITQSKLQQQKIQNLYEQQIVDLKGKLTSQEIDKPSIYSTDTEEEYDVFVSHATEDKESFADEFVGILKDDFGMNVWYDAVSIKWGDSIRSKIDQGLKKSKFGVVVLSRSYIKKHWTNYELEGLFQRESYSGKLILPIWHDITKKEVQDFSPTLAGKMAMNTDIMTATEIAENLKELLNESTGEEESLNNNVKEDI